ncbi:MAG: hypothetical protein V1921_02300 [Candidatus Altiarchaeota archaeon]
MTTKEKILVLVRATPEESTRYGHKVCVAGITEKGEWRRLYPFKFVYGEKRIDFKKKDIIEVELGEPDNDKRTESRKVFGYKNLNSPLDDTNTLKRILPLLSSIEKLEAKKASLGVIKPILSDIDVKVNDTKIYDDQAYFSLTGNFMEKREKVKMPIELRYHFKCENEPSCKGHKIILIDWELNELARNVLKKENEDGIAQQKIKERFYDFMLERDVYFILGTHFKFGTWMIIGLFYPPKELLYQKSLTKWE